MLIGDATLMMDANVVACSPRTVYNVLRQADVLRPRGKESRKGKGFVQPFTAYEHRHIDVAYCSKDVNGSRRRVRGSSLTTARGSLRTTSGTSRRCPVCRASARAHSGLRAMEKPNAVTGRSRASAFVLQRLERPRDMRLALTYPQVSLMRTGLCWKATRASERCRRQVL
jgi:hypothetical protein